MMLAQFASVSASFDIPKALPGVEKDLRSQCRLALARTSGRPGRRNHVMDRSNLPRHIVERFERRWAQKLEAQVHAWKPAKPSDRSMTDRGMPIVHRRKRAKPTKEEVAA